MYSYYDQNLNYMENKSKEVRISLKLEYEEDSPYQWTVRRYLEKSQILLKSWTWYKRSFDFTETLPDHKKANANILWMWRWCFITDFIRATRVMVQVTQRGCWEREGERKEWGRSSEINTGGVTLSNCSAISTACSCVSSSDW